MSWRAYTYCGTETLIAQQSVRGLQTPQELLPLLHTLAALQDLGPEVDDGQVTWKQQLCLNHARLRSTSVAVLEVNRRLPAGAVAQQGPASSGQVEIVAWAFTKIMQVGTWHGDP